MRIKIVISTCSYVSAQLGLLFYVGSADIFVNIFWCSLASVLQSTCMYDTYVACDNFNVINEDGDDVLATCVLGLRHSTLFTNHSKCRVSFSLSTASWTKASGLQLLCRSLLVFFSFFVIFMPLPIL